MEKQQHTMPPKVARKPVNWIEIAKDPSAFIDEKLYANKTIVDLNIYFGWKSYLLCNPDEIEYVFVRNQKNYCKGRLYDALRLSLGNGLVVSEGDFWKKQRRLMQPAFHKQILAGFAGEIERITGEMVATWKKRIQEGHSVFNVSDEMMKLTLNVALKLLFGSDIEGREERVLYLLNDLNERTIGKLKAPYNLPYWLPTPNNVKFKKHLEELHQIIEEIIQKRRLVSASEKKDLLQLLIDATDEDSGERMTEQQLKDEALSLFIAGSETSATTLAWTLCLFTENPSSLLKAQAEIDRLSVEGISGLDALRNMTYMNMAMQESMRIYPPVWMITREAIDEDVISGCKIEKGAQLYIPVRGMHNHPAYWYQPDKFSPERWQETDRPKFSYFPFGGGPRLCIGAELAKMEILLALYTLLTEFEFKKIDEVVVPEPLITLRPKGGLHMKVNIRSVNKESTVKSSEIVNA